MASRATLCENHSGTPTTRRTANEAAKTKPSNARKTEIHPKTRSNTIARLYGLFILIRLLHCNASCFRSSVSLSSFSAIDLHQLPFRSANIARPKANQNFLSAEQDFTVYGFSIRQ